VSDQFEFWLGRLPFQMQVILTTRTDNRLDEVTEQADRIHEVTCRTVMAVTSPSNCRHLQKLL